MVIVLFGVSGVGKTTLGRLLASQLGCPFFDADDYHPDANVEKMRSKIPLSDTDRAPWLENVRRLIETCIATQSNAVVACSALKESYRRLLTVDPDQVKFVYLKGGYALLKERLKNRRGHFMNPELLDSQFATLEEPRGDTTIVEVGQAAEKSVKQIRKTLKL